MAFIPEDGTGVPDANSLVSVEYADEYFTDRGVSDWVSLDQTSKETHLVTATDFMEGMRWIGYTSTEDQGLKWPRDIENYFGTRSGQDDSDMPEPIQNATCEYALKALDGSLYQDVTTSTNVKSRTDTVDTLSESVTYFGNSSVRTKDLQNRYGKPEKMIEPYLLRRARGFVR